MFHATIDTVDYLRSLCVYAKMEIKALTVLILLYIKSSTVISATPITSDEEVTPTETNVTKKVITAMGAVPMSDMDAVPSIQGSNATATAAVPKLSPKSDVEQDATARSLRPGRLLLNWDSQRTLTRRESSLIASPRPGIDLDDLSTFRSSAKSTGRLLAAGSSIICIPNKIQSRDIEKELVTLMFESMLTNIVEHWEVIPIHKRQEPTFSERTGSQLTLGGLRKKKTQSGGLKSSRLNISMKPHRTSNNSKLDIGPTNTPEVESKNQIWWSKPDEKAVITFRNGNMYEGDISMKCMHGDGKFQWTDGTVYLGNFKNNEMCGKGTIYWKDDTWYQGDFYGNVRHGEGLYVDSRTQRSYIGGWDCGTKHGQGVIYYDRTFNNSYDGAWDFNVRHGYGTREYCTLSGYKGEWDRNVREGEGLMIWPNHDFYRGTWKNGVMSGYGMYSWESLYNNTMSVPAINLYRGQWENGQRNGFGYITFGLELGSQYKGEFKNNKKHGSGTLVTNSGLMLSDKKLFIDNNISCMSEESELNKRTAQTHSESLQFNMYDNTSGLFYHVKQALSNIDTDDEIHSNIINTYFENNKIQIDTCPSPVKDEKKTNYKSMCDLSKFEERALLNSLRCYETDLRNIYQTYAMICNTEEVPFRPVLIRLYLWQFYYDCNIHEKGLTLVEIDKLLHCNRNWCTASGHDPFQLIYFWQFLHSLITVASKLYAKRQLPERKPETIVGTAFRTFMDNDVLPGFLKRKGPLVNGFGEFLPLKELYTLYQQIGDPHSIRTFIQCVRRSPHNMEHSQPMLVDASDECVAFGKNSYVFGDEMTFVTDKHFNCIKEPEDAVQTQLRKGLKLFNFGNLSSRAIIKIFSNILPQVSENDKIMDLNIEICFFEFFIAFVACAEESIRVKDDEIRWRQWYEQQQAIEYSTPHAGKRK